MKASIESKILSESIEKISEDIALYEEQCSNDTDLYTYKTLYFEFEERWEMALQYAKKAVQAQPYVSDVHYNLGYLYQVQGYLFEAYEQYCIAKELCLGGNSGSFSLDELDILIRDVLQQILEEQKGSEESSIQRKRWIDYMSIQNRLLWEVRSPSFHNGSDIIGQEYMDYPHLTKSYIGIAGLQSAKHFGYGGFSLNTLNELVEIQRVSDETTYYKTKLTEECFLPLLMSKRSGLIFKINGQSIPVLYTSPLQFVNYRIPKGDLEIFSQQDLFRVGQPVPIGHDEKRKRIVLNIFVDGLSQTVLDNHLSELMPHTCRFFEKGMICKNVHTAGDWTFPSIASIMTGQTLPTHKMLHSKLLRKIDPDTPLISEYFQAAGYNTTKIGGNWRIAPNYGYGRGFNRVFYQHMYEGLTAEKVISMAEEQMYCMRDTDQYIWMELGELHLIADELNMAPLISEFPITEITETQGKINSVKQNYDEAKIRYYKQQIMYLDRRLAGLYQYIEEHYSEEEIVVSLFADHGQGYLIPPDHEFLCDERTNIAFMTRGSGIEGQSEELISSCDYAPVMCRLAGIPFNYDVTDAHLPKTYGNDDEREFVVTESIHVGDPYQIILNGKDFTFYLKGTENVTSECRVPLDEYTVTFFDKKGEVIDDIERKQRLTQWCLKHIAPCVLYKN